MTPFYKHNFDAYVTAMQSAMPNAHNFRMPHISGGVSPVFIADSDDGTYVFKFNTARQVERNHIVGEILFKHDIPSIRTTTHQFRDMFFESYRYCPEHTLMEYINAGMPQDRIADAYCDAMRIQAKLTEINPNEFKNLYRKHYISTYKATLARIMSVPQLYLRVAIYGAMSHIGRVRIMNNDIQPRNILVDENGRVTRMIDLDSFALCSENISLIMMYTNNPWIHDSESFARILAAYESACGRDINRNRIMRQMDFIYTLRNRWGQHRQR